MENASAIHTLNQSLRKVQTAHAHPDWVPLILKSAHVQSFMAEPTDLSGPAYGRVRSASRPASRDASRRFPSLSTSHLDT